MPADDVSDLRDVVDAINKLCDTMKTSSYDEESAIGQIEEDTFTDASTFTSQYTDYSVVQGVTTSEYTEYFEVQGNTFTTAQFTRPNESEAASAQSLEYKETELVSPEEVMVQKTESFSAERWSDTTSQISLPGQADYVETVTSDTEPVLAQCEPVSEMYYTASSEVSLLSDIEVPERAQNEEESSRGDKKECVIAGHVAAMRERFESLTRTNTPCPDLIRSLSPSLEVFRNISPSPDKLA